MATQRKPVPSVTVAEEPGILNQPKSVWAVFFACIIAFMGLGLVDPILPAIAKQLDASPSQVTLLFTSYNAVMAVAMLVTGVITSRIGMKKTLLSGIVIIAVFSALGGLSNGIWELVSLRGGWGLGNALFVATALTAIVTLSNSGNAKAIILYEAAIGLGISVGTADWRLAWSDLLERTFSRSRHADGHCLYRTDYSNAQSKFRSGREEKKLTP